MHWGIFLFLVPSYGPQNISAKNITHNSMQTEFSPIPPAEWQGLLLGYKLRYCFLKNCSEIIKNITNVSMIEMKNLRSFRNFSISIVGFTKAGDGPMSPNIWAMTDWTGRLLFFRVWIRNKCHFCWKKKICH